MNNRKLIITVLIGFFSLGKSLIATCPSLDEVKASLSTLPNNFDPNAFSFYTKYSLVKIEDSEELVNVINSFPKITGTGKTFGFIPERYKLKSIEKANTEGGPRLKAEIKNVTLPLIGGNDDDKCRYIVTFARESEKGWGTWGTGEFVFTYEKSLL
jgi:hypothetical protein